ncbi:MAG: HigA family addiction module antidote protein [Bacteroidales bacterium]|nr:HigA family addiction module antidote protein [Bacteroidales bacterium]
MGTRNDIPVAVHPGRILKEELLSRGMKQKDFAHRIGMQASHLNEILNGNRSVSNEIAYKLEQELGIPATHWVKLQALYEYDVEVLKKQDIEEQEASNKVAEYDRIISVSTIFNRLNISARTFVERLSVLTTILGLPSPAEIEVNTKGSFRKFVKVGIDQRMILTWTILAKYKCAQQPLLPFKFDVSNANNLNSELSRIFHSNTDVIDRVKHLLNSYGIYFIIEEKVDKASIDGYSFMSNENPCIAVTLRNKNIDSFAFSVMHEIGHIVNGDIDDIESLMEQNPESSKEKRADKYAMEALVPEELWGSAPMVSMNVYMIQKEFTKWAKQNNLHKWIVLGRVSHDTGIWKFKGDGQRMMR